MRSICGMASDDLPASGGERAQPFDRRKAKCEAFVEWLPTICPRAEANGRYFEKGGRQNAKHFWNGFRRYGRRREAARAVTMR